LSTKERILRLVQQDAPESGVLPRKGVSRRALYRVDTEALSLDADIRAGATTVQGRLLNVSAAGCCVGLATPPTALDRGATASVTLHAGAHTLICNGEVVSLDATGEAAGVSAEVRLRFRGLPPQTQRALLAWLKELATAEFRQRHTKTSAISY